MRCAKWSFLLLLIVCFVKVNASHLRCGEISVRQVGDPGDRTFIIRVIAYTNSINPSAFFGGDQDYLDFGDGAPRILVPETRLGDPRYILMDAQRGIAMAYFEITHKYPQPGRYVVSYTEPNRNAGILNVDNSVNTTFYIETMITVSNTRNYSSPRFLTPPLFLAKAGEPYSISIAAEDPNGYTLFIHRTGNLARVVQGYGSFGRIPSGSKGFSV